VSEWVKLYCHSCGMEWGEPNCCPSLSPSQLAYYSNCPGCNGQAQSSPSQGDAR
jgi:hypothetical protein